MSLFNELKRRNVFRVGAAYVVIGWLLLQVADVLLGNFGAPDWVFKSFAAMLALGLPLALFLAWAFEMTADGVKRTEEVDADASIAPNTGRRLDRLVIIALLGVIVLMAAERFWFASDSPAVATDPATQAEIEKSIAVLPFSDFSPGGDNQWFADGLSEETLNSLVRVPDLLVAARTSSFNFRESTLPIPEIAAELGVAHVLEGSVRMGGDRVRVTAQLIRAADGFHVWSDTFDRGMADMIGIQEDLAREIAEAMETTMDPEALSEMAEVGTQSVEAYQAYIRGRAIEVFGGNPDAYALFEEARRIDPGFSQAHFRAARYWLIQSDGSRIDVIDTGLTADQMADRFIERIDAAIEAVPSEQQRMLYRGLKARFQLRFRDAIALFEAYLAERPDDFEAWDELAWLARQIGDDDIVLRGMSALEPLGTTRPLMAATLPSLAYRVNDPALAASQVERTLPLLERWPQHPNLHYQMHRALLWAGRVDEARRVHDRIFRVGMDVANSGLVRLRQACAEGRIEEARAIFDTEISDERNEQWLALLTMGRTDEAYEKLATLEEAELTYALASYLNYPQFDPTRFPSMMRVLAADGLEPQPLRPIPFACNRSGDDG